ncbi:MAG: L,D-transpeptidase family protein, partial [Planctomycetota bacterium]|nr:L,D-transpeptidase family protein [Planctomycetota bacterium]
RKALLFLLLIMAALCYAGYRYDILPGLKSGAAEKPSGGNQGQNGTKVPPEQTEPERKGDALFAAKKYDEALIEYDRELAALTGDNANGPAKRIEHVAARAGECHAQIGEKLMAAKKQYEARTELSRALRAPLPEERLAEIKDKTVKLNEYLIYSALPTADSVEYVVVAGDILKKIADKHGATYEAVMRVNRMNKDNIRVGQVLKILQGTYAIEVSLSKMRLSLWLDDKFIREFPVGTGRPDSPTPIGTFTIHSREKDPVWWSPDGNSYPPGHPKNILGSRWMGLRERPSYGIHGTTQPETIGTACSNGCIRMHSADVEEVFDFVPIGTKVIISE